MPGNGKVRGEYVRVSVDIPVDYEKDIRRWAVEEDMARSNLIRRELLKLIDRRRKKENT